MKSCNLFVTVIMLYWLLLGCNTPTPTPTVSSKSFKVAALFPRSVETDSWSKSGYEGLILIETELGAEVAYRDDIPESAFEATFREYAEAGFDYIIGHGGQFIPAAEIVAAEYPRTKFALTTKYQGNNHNLGALSLREGEMGYLLGTIAALKSKTKIITFIGGLPNSSNEELALLFERGAKATQPDIVVNVEWVDSWTDIDTALNITQAQLEAGADVFFAPSGGTMIPIMTMAAEADRYTIGWVDDLHDIAPDSMITSGIQDLPKLLARGASLAKKGRWEGKQYKFGLAEGVQDIAPFYGSLSSAEEAHVKQIKADIMGGKINLIP